MVEHKMKALLMVLVPLAAEVIRIALVLRPAAEGGLIDTPAGRGTT
jgi:hypothetical protein